MRAVRNPTFALISQKADLSRHAWLTKISAIGSSLITLQVGAGFTGEKSVGTNLRNSGYRKHKPAAKSGSVPKRRAGLYGRASTFVASSTNRAENAGINRY